MARQRSVPLRDRIGEHRALRAEKRERKLLRRDAEGEIAVEGGELRLDDERTLALTAEDIVGGNDDEVVAHLPDGARTRDALHRAAVRNEEAPKPAGQLPQATSLDAEIAEA